MTFDNVGYAMRELETCLTIIPFCIRVIVQLISFLRKLANSSCHDLESCGINVSDLIRFVDKGFAFVLAQS
jgi:hypothetical protein